MAFRSLGSLVRRSMGARSCFSSPGIAVEEAMGSAASGEAVTSGIAGSRLFHSEVAAQTPKMAVRPRDGSSLPGIMLQWLPAGRGGRRFHALRNMIVKHADGAAATLSVVVFSAIAGILHLIQQTEARKEDTPTKTPNLRSNQLLEEMIRERASYNKAITPDDEKAVVRGYMEEEDQAMVARFEERMEAHGRRTYEDEVEKARRFNDEASKVAGRSLRLGTNQFPDWNAEELARMCGIPGWRDGGYFKMALDYLAQQEIWHQDGSADIKEF